MADFILSPSQVHEFVSANLYPVNPEQKFRTRCIDGRYPNSESLPALAVAGGDAGELAALLAASHVYGFDLHLEKAAAAIEELVGGHKNMGFHTDTHADSTYFCGGCGHIGQIRKDPEAYDLTEEDIEALNRVLHTCREHGAHQEVLEGEHHEGAVLFLYGNYGVYPRYMTRMDDSERMAQVFIHHHSLLNQRHQELAEKLVASGAVKLADDLDSAYLYEIMADASDNHLMETLKRLASGLPIYGVKVTSAGEFEIHDMGTVESIV